MSSKGMLDGRPNATNVMLLGDHIGWSVALCVSWHVLADKTFSLVAAVRMRGRKRTMVG